VAEPGGSIRPVDKVHRPANRVIERIVRPGAELPKQGLQLAPAELDGVQVWRVRGQVQNVGPSAVDEAPDLSRPMGAHVVEHDDVAGLQLPEEEALEEGLENLRVGGALDGHHRADPHHVERPDHRRDRSSVARDDPARALAARGAGVRARHGDVAACLVDEHEPVGVEALRELDELAPEGLDAGLALLNGGQTLFFRVSASFSSTRFIEDRLTLRPVRR